MNKTLLAVIASLLLATSASAEQYKHKCSTNKHAPTVVDNNGKPLTRAIISVQTRRFYAGVTPKIEVEQVGGKTVHHSKFTHRGELKQCYFAGE